MTENAVHSPDVALVTGGSRGIGRAVVETLAQANWRVYFCSHNRDSLAKADQELREIYPHQVSGWLCDVADEDQIDEFVGRVANEEGHIDCLVNNAGIGHFAPVEEITGEDWRRVIETNLNAARGPWHRS